MNFTGFPINYKPLTHIDKNGTPDNDETTHAITQGWLQAYSSLNQILTGQWVGVSLNLTNCTQNNALTPYSLGIFLNFSANQSAQNVSLKKEYFGALDLIRGSTLIEKIVVSGSTLNLPTLLSGDVVTGFLVPRG